MKANKIFILSATMALMFISQLSLSQNINWESLQQEQRNIVNVSAAYDYSFSYGLGYGYHLKSRLPIVLGIEHSQPAGQKVFDDFKTKLGGQVRVYQVGHFQLTAKVQGIFRRYENSYVRMLNFGSDMSATMGYYRRGWYVAAEAGFDKAIVTHFKHTSLYRENFPGARDGWYVPATGGNFYYGFQTGASFGQNDVTMKIGQVIEQDFTTKSVVPFYFQLGYNRRF